MKTKKSLKIACLAVMMLIFCQVGQIFGASCGDVNSNGATDIVDALIVAQYYVGLNPPGFDSAVADVNRDGSINIIDALIIAQFYVGLIDALSCRNADQEPIWSGGPYTFNGSGDYIDLPDGFTDDLGDFSAVCWVYLKTLDAWSRIFDFGSSTDVFMMLSPASGNTGNPCFAITLTGNSGEQTIESTVSLPTGSWQHLAVVKNGTAGILYINGQEAGRNDNITLNPSDMGHTTSNYIGRSQWSHDPYLNGNIADFLIYDNALNAQEIAALGSNPPPAITPGPTPATTPGPTARPSRSFWALDTRKSEMDQSAWYQFTANLAKEGNRCIVYLQAGKSVSQSIIDTLVSDFDTNIWRAVTTNFGNPVDIDGNQKVILLLMDIVDNYASSGGYVAGYFFPLDLYTSSQVTGLGYPSYCKSNEAELLYIDINPNNPSTKAFRSTVAHEFQHLVNMSRNVFEEDGDDAPVWINEGFSMAAESVYQNVPLLQDREAWYDNDPLLNGTGTVPKDQAKSISAGYPMAIWNPYPSNPYAVFNNYSLSHLFFAWLRIQMGSDSFFRNILESRDNTVQSVVSVCSATLGTDVDTYAKMLGRFWMANLLGGRGKTSGLESYKGLNSHSGPHCFSSGNRSITLYASGSMCFNNVSMNNWSPAGGDSQISYELGNISSLTADYGSPYGTGNSGSEYLIVYNNESGGTRQRTSAVLPDIMPVSAGQILFTRMKGTTEATTMDFPDSGLRKGREPGDTELIPPVNW